MTAVAQRAAECRSCHAQILWGKTRNGVLMPLDLEPTDNGNALLHGDGMVDVLGPLELIAHDSAALPLRMPHHATCPDQDMWRRS